LALRQNPNIVSPQMEDPMAMPIVPSEPEMTTADMSIQPPIEELPPPDFEESADLGAIEEQEMVGGDEVMQYGISEEKLEEIRQNVEREIQRADNYYEEEIEPEVIRRHKVYEGDPAYYKKKFPKLTNISDVTASDFHDTVEWALPSLTKVFFGNEDICKL